MKKLLLYIILILISNISFAEKIPIPELESPITDLTATLSDQEIKFLEQKLLSFESDSTAQIVVLIISTTGEETIEEYSMRLAELWKIGFEKEDNGIIIIIAKDDRMIRIEVGYGLEHKITDSDASDIIDNEITPEFKSGNFYSGINMGIDKLIFSINNEPVINEESEISIQNYRPTKEILELRNKKWYMAFILILIVAQFTPMFLSKSKLWILIVVIVVLLSFDLWLGYITNDMEIAWMYMTITGVISFIPLLINIFNVSSGTSTSSSYSSNKKYSSGSSSSSWSSSSSSSRGSSSGSSYSGGGGSFGGGGASGSWKL